MVKVELVKQKGYNFLWIDEYLWMWDIPRERRIQKQLADEAYGDVLVAGYGLGIIQECLLQNPKVTSVTTVEKLKEVLELVKSEYGKLHGSVELADFYKYNTTTQFDCVIGDIWDDIDSSNLNVYKKFKAKAKTLLKPNGNVLGWGADYFEFLIKQEK
jgi:spermidine synthase